MKSTKRSLLLAGTALMFFTILSSFDGGNIGLDNYPSSFADTVKFVEVQELDVPPKPQGGMKGWNNYLSQNLKVPQTDRGNGTVIVVFLVQEDGSVTDVELLKSVSKGCDKAAMDVVKKSPKWEPGELDGKKVTSRMRLPIRFSFN
ncbi:energy transducer TonB [Algoriphagus aquimarinus]|uniref:Energy transducer TonB n=1 Tax=Algoriphagus aquimarinus TaxID=237018 RepID=A0A5C7AXU3_9BACT|nr:energy transducer TonB [Algoriphagus aquimarinus]TXE13620.1 energy transducer TonB [Algoriphagus aquimarinus]